MTQPQTTTSRHLMVPYPGELAPATFIHSLPIFMLITHVFN